MAKVSLVAAILLLIIFTSSCGVHTAPTDNSSISLTPTILSGSSPMTVQSSSPGILPHSLYFLSPSASGSDQVWRLASDGKSLEQVTTQTGEITDFDISPVSGALAFISSNRLFLQPPGQSPILQVDGMQKQSFPAGEKEFIQRQKITSPRWSPDGQSLAYGLDGIHIFQSESRRDQKILPNLPVTPGESGYQPAEERIYSPYAWSPDGSMLLVEYSINSVGSSLAVVSLPEGNLVLLQAPAENNPGRLVCCEAAWSPDGRQIYVANPHPVIDRLTGLWLYQAETGTGTGMIAPVSPDQTHNLAGWPFLGPDRLLTYFFANLPAKPDTEIPLSLVQSRVESPGERILIKPEAFLLREVLWGPDGRLAIVVQAAPGLSNSKPEGPVLLVFVDRRPAEPLAPSGFHLRWGP